MSEQKLDEISEKLDVLIKIATAFAKANDLVCKGHMGHDEWIAWDGRCGYCSKIILKKAKG